MRGEGLDDPRDVVADEAAAGDLGVGLREGSEGGREGKRNMRIRKSREKPICTLRDTPFPPSLSPSFSPYLHRPPQRRLGLRRHRVRLVQNNNLKRGTRKTRRLLQARHGELGKLLHLLSHHLNPSFIGGIQFQDSRTVLGAKQGASHGENS